MEFGHVAPEELNTINFELPPDPPQTIRTLQESKPTADFDMRIGATKWGRKEWIGNFYPKGTQDSHFCLEYVKHFNSIFLNATFTKSMARSSLRSRKTSQPLTPILGFTRLFRSPSAI